MGGQLRQSVNLVWRSFVLQLAKFPPCIPADIAGLHHQGEVESGEREAADCAPTPPDCHAGRDCPYRAHRSDAACLCQRSPCEHGLQSGFFCGFPTAGARLQLPLRLALLVQLESLDLF